MLFCIPKDTTVLSLPLSVVDSHMNTQAHNTFAHAHKRIYTSAFNEARYTNVPLQNRCSIKVIPLYCKSLHFLCSF